MLGIGAMLGQLSGRNGAEHLQVSIGKTIASVACADDRLSVRFTDGSGIVLRDNGQSCCEHRYITCGDALDSFVGAELMSVEIREAPSLSDPNGNHEVQFLAIITSKGTIVAETHNEHNGYYGGFWIVVEPLEPANA